jgi:hypothetical protein
MDTLNFSSIIEAYDSRYVSDFNKESLGKIIAVYVINSSSCSPCINEVTGFINMFKKTDFYGREVKNIILLQDKNTNSSERFIQTTDFKVPTLFGYVKKHLQILNSFNNRFIERQLILVNTELDPDIIFFRMPLSKGNFTTAQFKANALDAAMHSYQRSKDFNSKGKTNNDILSQ